jgi:hypothetical protein
VWYPFGIGWTLVEVILALALDFFLAIAAIKLPDALKASVPA